MATRCHMLAGVWANAHVKWLQVEGCKSRYDMLTGGRSNAHVNFSCALTIPHYQLESLVLFNSRLIRFSSG